MKVIAELYDTKTGEEVTDETDWKDGTDPGAIVTWWTESNFSCDCNRAELFGMDDHPCNSGRNRFRLTRLTIDGKEVEDIEA